MDQLLDLFARQLSPAGQLAQHTFPICARFIDHLAALLLGHIEFRLGVGSTDGVYTDTSAAPFWIYQSVPWLQVTPAGGILLQGESQPLTLDFDSTGLADGLYNGFLVIVSNAGTSPEVVPVDLTVESIVSGVGDVPNVFGLTGNVPNPFNPATQVRFSLARDGMAEIDVLDLQGRVVRTLLSGIMTAGEQTVRWDGRDDAGRNVASGAYFVRLRSAGQVATHKVTLMK